MLDKEAAGPARGRGGATVVERTSVETPGKRIWWNGEMVPESEARVPVTSLGWAGVEGVFEGMRGYYDPAQGELFVFRLREHLDRLMRSIRLMGMTSPWGRDDLADACLRTLRENDCRQDVYLQPLAYVPGAGGGKFFESDEYAIYIDWWPAPSRLGGGHAQTACVSSWRRIGEEAMPPRVKNLSNYRNSKLASREARRNGCDTAILLNAAGQVAEGPAACVVLVRDGAIVTPDLTSGILESVTRDAVLRLARESLGLEVRERPVDRSELYVADEVFFVGNAVEVTPLAAIDGLVVGDGAPGPVTRRLAGLLHDVARGTSADYAEWRAAVGIAAIAAAR